MDAPALAHSYDPQTDVLTVEGVPYAARIFRCVASAQVPRAVVAIERGADGKPVLSLLSGLKNDASGAKESDAGNAG